MFFLDLAFKLLEHTKINDHSIKLVNANGFIKSLKSFAEAPILFGRKLDRFFWLCINYRGLNNLMIKNRCPLLLVKESLDSLGRVRWFTQLNLTSTYY